MKIPLAGCGTLSVLWGLLFTCAGFGMMIDPAAGKSWTDGIAPAIVIGMLPLAVGIALSTGAAVLHWRDRRVARVLAWLRTRDRFTLDEYAKAHGLTVVDAELNLVELLGRPRAPAFVFHRSTREYMLRSSIRSDARLVERCQSCGAPQRVLLLSGEPGACSSCGAPL